MSKLLFHIGGRGIPPMALVHHTRNGRLGMVSLTRPTPTSSSRCGPVFRRHDTSAGQIDGIHSRAKDRTKRAGPRSLNRDYSNVHADVAALLEAHLLEKRGTTLMVTWDGERPRR
jgi:hypothetical protein